MERNECWICNSPSKTKEHRIKKSDIVERFGKGPYRAHDSPIHIKEDKIQAVQGPNSNLIKYEKNLCENCNSAFTQPFDKAYERFIRWVDKNENQIVSKRVIDFEVVYGASWEERQRSLFKYFAKCFGCRLDEAGRKVPADVVDLLSKDTFRTAFYVTFHLNQDPVSSQGIGVYGLMADKVKLTDEETGFWCGNIYRWLGIRFWYHHYSREPVGAPWIANSKFLYLGYYDKSDVF